MRTILMMIKKTRRKRKAANMMTKKAATMKILMKTKVEQRKRFEDVAKAKLMASILRKSEDLSKVSRNFQSHWTGLYRQRSDLQDGCPRSLFTSFMLSLSCDIVDWRIFPAMQNCKKSLTVIYIGWDKL